MQKQKLLSDTKSNLVIGMLGLHGLALFVLIAQIVLVGILTSVMLKTVFGNEPVAMTFLALVGASGCWISIRAIFIAVKEAKVMRTDANHPDQTGQQNDSYGDVVLGIYGKASKRIFWTGLIMLAISLLSASNAYASKTVLLLWCLLFVASVFQMLLADLYRNRGC